MSLSTISEVDVMVGSRLIVDPDVYEFWLNGNTAHEAAVNLQNNGILLKYQATFEDLLSDTRDHYRTFVGLERLVSKKVNKCVDDANIFIFIFCLSFLRFLFYFTPLLTTSTCQYTR